MKRVLLTAVLACIIAGAMAQKKITAPSPVGPLPESHQVEWQQMETYAFIHFGLNTFNDREWGYGNSPLESFNPSKLDCRQWVRILKQAGMKGVILTAKHHDGFCLWQTQQTEYSIINTPFANGEGDIVAALAQACREEGLKLGLYLSPWDRNRADYGEQSYVEYFYAELHELLTRYGEIFEIWFDGANGGDGYYGGAMETRKIDRRTYYDFPRAWSMVRELQPKAVIFSDGGPGCRWVGNEDGYAFATNWSLLRSKEVYPGYPRYWELQMGHVDGDKWIPAECDVSIRPGWFYHAQEDSRVKTPQQLAELYYRSVGHNSTLLLNFPVDKDGLIHPIDSANAVDFHKLIAADLSTDLLQHARVKASSIRGKEYGTRNLLDDDYDSYWATPDNDSTATLIFRFKKKTRINRLLLQEYILLGQRVESFDVSYLDGKEWIQAHAGEETTTIGYKRILRLSPFETRALRIRFLKSRGPLCLNKVAAYCAPETEKQEESTSTEIKGKPFTIAEQTETRVVLDFGQQTQLRSFFYQPETGDERKGLVSNFALYVGESMESLHKVAEGEFSNIRNHPVLQQIYFTPTDGRFLVMEATRMVTDNEPLSFESLAAE